ncbi:MAG: 4Fe-4S dicluster domain-containing protein [Lachnospiraceae bacterium]|jgi:iron only hydrogenase large subunit-like protein|nr:4Fe-4S dicluster domain-containing protein [Lachnospiraceae bacterium]
MGDFLKLKKSNCVNCYKCIRHCPVKSIRFSGGQANIIANECILCGQCFVVCPQNAKEVADDREKVRVLMAENETVVASLAPSFIANWEGIGIKGMENALKKLGFAQVEETAIGATIVKREYERILREDKPDILISSCCHSINLLIQKHYPFAMPYLANVVSPMQAHSIDIKKRYPGAKTVFIGPCVAKKDEVEHYKGIVDACLTFEELRQMFEEAGIEPEPDMDTTEKSKARIFPTAGGVIATMELSDEYTYLAIDGTENCIAALKDIEGGHIHKCFIEMNTCKGSCSNGPVMEKYKNAPVRSFQNVSRYAGKEDFEVDELTKLEKRKIYEYIEQTAAMPNENQIREILLKMGKNDKSQEINCGSCGYATCRDKAVAIFQGKAEVSMCLPFLKDRAESFSGSIINNTPNAIIILNEKLEVQQLNKAACAILNLNGPNSIMGEQVVRIMDPKDFMEVLNSGISIHNKRTYLTDYRKFVEETIIYDPEYRNLLCIMRDITSEEEQREKKEEICRSTIEVADKVVEKQMRIVQEIASLLGETAAETKIALTKLKESVQDE